MMTNWKDVKAEANLDPARVAEKEAELIEKIKNFKQTPAEWEKQTGIKILDPDGWRGSYADKTFDEPLTAAEWNERMMVSTIITLKQWNRETNAAI